MHNIEIDESSGFCFGVTTAIRKAEEELEYEPQFDRVLENDCLDRTLAEAENIVKSFAVQ